jgi:penicillin-insensitive murein endopeptidase
VGGHALGCIGGAVALPAEGPGWQVVRLSRNRFWGHPSLVAFVQDFTGRARAMGYADLWIGDMSQPRGGPMPYGHASHQIGLDVDIWFDISRKPALSREQRETITVASLVLPDQSDADPARFTPEHVRLIRMAAESPNVERVLVNHGIKRALCRTHGGEAWLRRVRPWRGHDQHMHVRLRCPPGSPECRDQPPPPPGDGCDSSLDWWLSSESRRPAPQRPSGPPPQLPAACAGVLNAP